jgi:hypothetical protein
MPARARRSTSGPPPAKVIKSRVTLVDSVLLTDDRTDLID